MVVDCVSMWAFVGYFSQLWVRLHSLLFQVASKESVHSAERIDMSMHDIPPIVAILPKIRQYLPYRIYIRDSHSQPLHEHPHTHTHTADPHEVLCDGRKEKDPEYMNSTKNSTHMLITHPIRILRSPEEKWISAWMRHCECERATFKNLVFFCRGGKNDFENTSELDQALGVL